MTTTTMRTIEISGDFRRAGFQEFAGSGTVDAAGRVECAADFGDDTDAVYDAIESAIRGGKTRGSVTVQGDGREIICRWVIS